MYIFYPISTCGKFKTSIRSVLHLKKILRNLIDFLDKILQRYTKSLIFLVKICKNFTFRALLQKPTSLTLMFYYTNYILRTFIDKLRWIYILKKDWYSERCYSKSNCYYGKITRCTCKQVMKEVKRIYTIFFKSLYSIWLLDIIWSNCRYWQQMSIQKTLQKSAKRSN